MSGEESDEVIRKEISLSRKLYPSLSLVEISLYTATWICGVYLACHSLYLASQEQARRLYMVDLVRPWWYEYDLQSRVNDKLWDFEGHSGVPAW